MALKPSEVGSHKHLLSQPPSVDQLEKYADYALMGKERPVITDMFVVEVRLPDASVIADLVLDELEKRFLEKGWDQVRVRYGGKTEEEEYQTHLVFSYRRLDRKT